MRIEGDVRLMYNCTIFDQEMKECFMRQQTKSMVTDMTTGNVTRLLLNFAFPLFVSNALQAVYNIVDMIVVGQYIGGAGMSAVSIGGDVLHLLTFVAMGFSSAGQVLIARDVGSRNMDRVKKNDRNHVYVFVEYFYFYFLFVLSFARLYFKMAEYAGGIL